MFKVNLHSEFQYSSKGKREIEEKKREMMTINKYFGIGKQSKIAIDNTILFNILPFYLVRYQGSGGQLKTFVVAYG